MTTKRTVARKAALAVAILSATLILPGSAVGSHNPGNHRNPYTCDPSIPGDCPAFEANALFQLSNPVKGSLSAVNFMFSQPDRRLPVMKADYYLPAGWRFGGLPEIDPAPAGSTCNSIHNSDGSLNNAEGLSADTGMLIQREGRRFDDPTDDEEAVNPVADNVLPGFSENSPPVDYGYRPTDPITGNPRRYPSVSFLDWDGTNARLCYHHRTNDNTKRGQLPVTFIGGATLTRLAGDPSFDWKLSLDLSHVYKDSASISNNASILKHTVSLNALTSGTWNRFHGELSRQPFSRTPETAGDYPFRAQLFTCQDGFNAGTSTGCDGDTYSSPLTVNQTVRIAPAPDLVPHDFGKITAPVTPDLCFNAVCPAALSLGQSSSTVRWNPPALAEGQSVMGYVLTIARPGDQASRKHFRLITNPAAPGGQTSTACGATGTDPCSLTLNFPMQSTDGSTTLTNDGMYHLALVTTFMSNGRRTDGLCDGGNADLGDGVSCPASVAPLEGGQNEGNLIEPGISEWQLMMRPDSWPHVFVETYDDGSNSSFDPILNRLMLVNWSQKKAELIVWRTNDREVSFKGISNGIVGDDALGAGAVSFATNTTAGSTQNWAVNAFADVFGGLNGTFAQWDAKNPSLNPPNIAGYPTVKASPICPFFFFGASPDCVLIQMTAL